MAMESNPDYAAFRSAFRVEDLAAQLSGDLQTGLNVCTECCDRHAETGKVALYWEGKDGRSESYTFAELQELSARFANFLRARGIGPGDRVAGLLPRTPELLVVALGTWRAGGVDQQRADERRCRRGTHEGLSVEVGDGRSPADHDAEPDQRCIGRPARRDLLISGSNSSEVLRDDRGGFVNQNFAPGYATAT